MDAVTPIWEGRLSSAYMVSSIKQGAHISGERLVKYGCNQSSVDDSIVTAKRSTKVNDCYHDERAHHSRLVNNIPTASDSSCLANRIGGIANLPGPLSDPAVSELWILLGS